MGSEVSRIIPNGLQNGKVIEIRGTVPFLADVFEVNFLAGEEPDYCDRPLHISVRFDGRIVVRNTFQRNSWQREEREGLFPFNLGQKFLMKIVIEMNCYQIFVNNQHCWDFVHRIPFQTVKTLFIKGSVNIEGVEFKDKYQPQYVFPSTTCQPGYPYPGVPTAPPPPTPVYNPTIPYTYPIHGGIKPGTLIYISGKPTLNPYRFTINVQTSSYGQPDIAFHFDVRFFNGTIVRNTRSNNRWQNEETRVPHFPFQPNVRFDMIVQVTDTQFMVAVNGQHFVEFWHRMKPLSRFDSLYLENDLTVQSIRVA